MDQNVEPFYFEKLPSFIMVKTVYSDTTLVSRFFKRLRFQKFEFCSILYNFEEQKWFLWIIDLQNGPNYDFGKFQSLRNLNFFQFWGAQSFIFMNYRLKSWFSHNFLDWNIWIWTNFTSLEANVWNDIKIRSSNLNF